MEDLNISADILLFTDNKEALSILENYLSFGNHFIHFATKDENGLRTLSKNKFDLVIVEISEPLLSEIEFIEKINALNNSTPILIVSEYFSETRNTVFGNKVTEFVSKPFTMEKLLKTVNNVLHPGSLVDGDKITTSSAQIESKRLSVLYEMSKSLNSITDFNLLLKTIINLATDALNAERATIFIYDRLNNEIWSRVGTGLELKEIRFPISKGIAGEVIATGYSVITDNPYNHPAFNSEFDKKTGFVTRNLLCVPMKNLNGILVGAFQILNKRSGQFTAQDELFLSAMAASTAIAIENTLLHEENIAKYNEMVKLYDDLYTAQNMIVRETKLSTISEIRGYIREIRKYDGVFDMIQKARLDDSIPSEFKDLLAKIEMAYQKSFVKFGMYLNQLINEFGKDEH
jgi:DNA-binding response OmpR family regulator